MESKDQIKQTIQEFLSRMDISNSEVCWISPVSLSTRVVCTDNIPRHLVRAIFHYFSKKYNGRVNRSCGNRQCLNPQHLQSMTAEERFWSNIFIGDDEECWEWSSLSGTSRYGNTRMNGESVTSHRMAYELTYGEIPDGLYVCHHCDNPPCCNPNHLFLGTHQDNVNDRERKGRNKMPGSIGEDHGNSKLTESQVLEIRDLYNRPEHSYYTLGRMYKVSPWNIRKVIKRQTWRHI